MNYRFSVLLIFILVFGCTNPPEIIPDGYIDLTYDELKADYRSCIGKGIMTSKGTKSWKLNYTFTTRNDSSFIQFRDIFGRRILFVEAIPTGITLWDIQENIQYAYKKGTSILILDMVGTYDIAQILWGEVPVKFVSDTTESSSERNSNLVNFGLSASNIGMVLDRITFNIDSLDTVIDFKIFEREFGKNDLQLSKGIPLSIPYN